MAVRILVGDAIERLHDMPDESVHCVVTSPPYFGLRDYGTAQWDGGEAACDHLVVATGSTQNKGNNGKFGQPFRDMCGKCGALRIDRQIGLEPSPAEYVETLVAVFREVRRVLRRDGTLWLNMGDSYAGAGTIGRNDTTPEALTRRADKYRTGTGTGSKVGSQGTRPRVSSLKPKDLLGIPWMVAFALQADGWWLRQDIIWSKPNPMPESVTDRCTKAHEYLFLLSRSERYYFDQGAIREAGSTNSHGGTPNQGGPKRISQNHGGRLGVPARGRERGRPAGAATFEKFGHNTSCGTPQDGFRNRRSVWEIATAPYAEAHFATFPPALVEPCILAGSPRGGTVLDPFGGAGTTALVADRLGRDAILIELNPAYAEMARSRVINDAGMFAEVAYNPQPELAGCTIALSSRRPAGPSCRLSHVGA